MLTSSDCCHKRLSPVARMLLRTDCTILLRVIIGRKSLERQRRHILNTQYTFRYSYSTYQYRSTPYRILLVPHHGTFLRRSRADSSYRSTRNNTHRKTRGSELGEAAGKENSAIVDCVVVVPTTQVERKKYTKSWLSTCSDACSCVYVCVWLCMVVFVYA
jgi:hypothetical protein